MKENTYYYKEQLSVDFLNPVKKRPGMYIGTLDNKGIVSMIFTLFEELSIGSESKIYFMVDENKFNLKFENINLKLTEPASKGSFIGSGMGRGLYSVYVPCALSINSTMIFKSSLTQTLFKQKFENGKVIEGASSAKASHVSCFELDFELDTSFFSKSFKVDVEYLFVGLC